MSHYEQTMYTIEEFKKANFTEEQTRVILRAVESTRKGELENLATKEDMANYRQDTKDDIANVRQEISDVKAELKQEISDVKSELKQDIHALELKIGEVKSELKQDINNSHQQIKEDIHKIDLKVSDIRNEFTKLDGNFYLLKWMFGFIGTACLTTLGILIRIMLKQ